MIIIQNLRLECLAVMQPQMIFALKKIFSYMDCRYPKSREHIWNIQKISLKKETGLQKYIFILVTQLSRFNMKINDFTQFTFNCNSFLVRQLRKFPSANFVLSNFHLITFNICKYFTEIAQRLLDVINKSHEKFTKPIKNEWNAQQNLRCHVKSQHLKRDCESIAIWVLPITRNSESNSNVKLMSNYVKIKDFSKEKL